MLQSCLLFAVMEMATLAPSHGLNVDFCSSFISFRVFTVHCRLLCHWGFLIIIISSCRNTIDSHLISMTVSIKTNKNTTHVSTCYHRCSLWVCRGLLHVLDCIFYRLSNKLWISFTSAFSSLRSWLCFCWSFTSLWRVLRCSSFSGSAALLLL